ncbi:MAG: carboxyl transferase domain-containing protein, partial [Terriglobales bacterium]
VMGAEAAVNVIHRREIEAATDPAAERKRLTAEYRDRFASPFPAAERGYVDAVIAPRTTRARLIEALEMLQGKRAALPKKKHGNIPL